VPRLHLKRLNEAPLSSIAHGCVVVGGVMSKSLPSGVLMIE